MKTDRNFMIFIIEDSEIYSTMLNYVLSKDKCIDTMIFNNIEECQHYNGRKPNLIILDHNLNGIEDLTPFKLIKELYKKIPIIIMSSEDDIDIIFKYMDIGATDYVIKDDTCFDLIRNVVNSIRNGILSPRNILTQIHTLIK